MKTNDIIHLVRRHLGDLDGAVFSDGELARFVSKAARDYSRDSKAFRGECPFVIENGFGKYPSDFLGVLHSFNDYGMEVLATSSQRAARFRSDYHIGPGRPVRIMYDNESGDSGYRVSPVPRQDTIEHYDEGGYGIFTQLYGGIFGYSYGIVFAWRQLENLGGFQYVRVAEVEEIQDHLALVFDAVAQALNEDTDLARNEDSVRLYRNMYVDRIGSRRTVTRSDALTARDGEYF